MNKNNNKLINIKFYILLSIFIPIFLLTGEVICFALIKINNLKNPSNLKVKNDLHLQTFDVTTVSNRFDIMKDEIIKEEGYINRHGLIKTIYNSNSLKNENIEGVLITGNSVALGYPLNNKGFYKNNFVNLIEAELREKDNNIDLINLSYYGFNSWQENIQLTRYFNSEMHHTDLPSNIKLIASLGGIQDFWQFLDLLFLSNTEKNIFHNANGLMTGQAGDYLVKLNEAINGNYKIAGHLFISKLVRDIRRKSNIYRFIQFLSTNNRKIINIEEEKLSKPNNYSLENLINKKLNLSFNEYQKRKDIVIGYVIRNIKSMSTLNNNNKMLFVYLPTKFGHKEDQLNNNKRYNYKNILNSKDLYILEKDYRESLIKKLKGIKNLSVENLASIGTDNWFHDESHYSLLGHKNIAKELVPIFAKVLEK